MTADPEWLALPEAPFLPVLRLPDDEVEHDVAERFRELSDAIRAAAPHALPLVVLGRGADVALLGDGDLAALGLARVDRVWDAWRRYADDDDVDAMVAELDALRSGRDTPGDPG